MKETINDLTSVECKISNGQEFKGFIKELRKKPDVICIQETWLKPRLDFVIKGYESVR